MDDYSKVICVFVDNGKKEYIVPERLLFARSDVFKAACAEPWQDGGEPIVRLPEISTNTMNLYLHWIYKGELYANVAIEDNATEPSSLWVTCITHWICGKVFGDVLLRNVAMNHLLKLLERDGELPAATDVALSWHHAPPESTLNRFMLDTYSTHLSNVVYLQES